MLNTQKKPFDDRRVRQAFNYAINKEDSVRLAGGRAVVANGFLPPYVPGHDPHRPPYPHDPARARALLAEAGYASGLAVTYTTLRDDLAQKLAHSIQADLAEVGVRVDIEQLTFPAYLDAMSRGELSFAFLGWSMDFPDPWDFLEVKFHGRMIGSTNETKYDNPEVDRLLDAARAEPDRSKRLDLYRRAEDLIYADCPAVWHNFPVAVDVWQPVVRGAGRHPVRGLFFRDAWFDDPARRAH
jgi:ABC-type transport system substrate-binding protein